MLIFPLSPVRILELSASRGVSRRKLVFDHTEQEASGFLIQ